MSSDDRSFKNLAKSAKQRLKEGFWQKLEEEVSTITEEKSKSTDVRLLKNYLTGRAVDRIKNSGRIEDEFFERVRFILDSVGEAPDMLGRLTDKEYFITLSYEAKQRYILALSEKYLLALERYKREYRGILADSK